MSKDIVKSIIGMELNGYLIKRYIASGSFGDVYEAENKKTNELVALKIPIMTEEKNGERCLLEELDIYKVLNKNKCHGISNAKVISNKKLGKKIIIMDLLGDSLEALMQKSEKKRLSLKTILLLAMQMIKILKDVHDAGYIHRDLKPDNFVIDIKTNNIVYCIDFGLAKKYINEKEHVELKKNGHFCGTARYASLAAHKGYTQSRKDDLESLGYLLIYLYKGKLKWMGIKNKDKKQRYKLIQEEKEKMTDEKLCEKLPRQFLVYFKYIHSLDFNEKPRYTSLINMFKKLYEERGYKDDKFEWVHDPLVK